jgi:hypothetical protein
MIEDRFWRWVPFPVSRPFSRLSLPLIVLCGCVRVCVCFSKGCRLLGGGLLVATSQGVSQATRA